MHYVDKSGKKITVGRQNLTKETVELVDGNKKVDAPMFSDEDGDIGFVYNGEEVFFRFLKPY
ncbi:hypothetical protein [Bacillus sp. NEAU-Y102]